MTFSDKQRFHDVPDKVKVPQGDYNFAISPQILETSGLGPCIGVAIYDPSTEEGAMAHFQGPSQDTYPVETFLDSAINSSSYPIDLKIWIRGGEILSDPELIDHCIANREFIEQSIFEMGIDEENVDLVWNNDNDVAISISLDCENGEFKESATDLKETFKALAKNIRYLNQ